MNLFTKQKQIYRLKEQTHEYQQGKGKDELGIWDGHVCTAILKITKNKNNQQRPTAWHRELCSIFCNNLNRKKIFKEYIHV